MSFSHVSFSSDVWGSLIVCSCQMWDRSKMIGAPVCWVGSVADASLWGGLTGGLLMIQAFCFLGLVRFHRNVSILLLRRWTPGCSSLRARCTRRLGGRVGSSETSTWPLCSQNDAFCIYPAPQFPEDLCLTPLTSRFQLEWQGKFFLAG